MITKEMIEAAKAKLRPFVNTEEVLQMLAEEVLTAALSVQWRGMEDVPDDTWHAFAWFISKCAGGFGTELMKEGRTNVQARNAIIGCFLDFAAGEACRIARSEGREPDPEKWTKAVNDAFERGVKRTLPPPPAQE